MAPTHHAAMAGRGRALPAVTMPSSRDDRRVSGALSLLVHIVLIALLATPFAVR